jgi:hypothetical protein
MLPRLPEHPLLTGAVGITDMVTQEANVQNNHCGYQS